MLKVAPLVALALLALPMPALAEDAPGTDHDRYVLEKAGDGFIRLDRETGALSRCLEKSGSWACESIADVFCYELSERIDGLRYVFPDAQSCFTLQDARAYGAQLIRDARRARIEHAQRLAGKAGQP